MNLLAHLRAVAMITLATVVLIAGSNFLSLGAFGVHSILGVLALSVVLTVVAWVFYAIVAIAVMAALKLKTPGVLLSTIGGVIGGAAAIATIAAVSPSTILLSGVVAPIAYSAVNTGLVWLIGWLSGKLRKDLAFYPTR